MNLYALSLQERARIVSSLDLVRERNISAAADREVAALINRLGGAADVTVDDRDDGWSGSCPTCGTSVRGRE